MIKIKSIFSVFMVAILLAGPAIAFDPAETATEDDTVATKHTVYTFDAEDGRAKGGIAGVLYVNKAVDIAGGAAGAAEAHAAAAGSAAISAAASADAAAGAAAAAAGSAQSAINALADKVTIDQGPTNANKAVITDKDGKITTGTIKTDMIGNDQVTAEKTSGVIGYIPSGSATSTTYAQIWVQ